MKAYCEEIDCQEIAWHQLRTTVILQHGTNPEEVVQDEMLSLCCRHYNLRLLAAANADPQRLEELLPHFCSVKDHYFEHKKEVT